MGRLQSTSTGGQHRSEIDIKNPAMRRVFLFIGLYRLSGVTVKNNLTAAVVGDKDAAAGSLAHRYDIARRFIAEADFDCRKDPGSGRIRIPHRPKSTDLT